jgi:hypothetical protein
LQGAAAGVAGGTVGGVAGGGRRPGWARRRCCRGRHGRRRCCRGRRRGRHGRRCCKGSVVAALGRATLLQGVCGGGARRFGRPQRCRGRLLRAAIRETAKCWGKKKGAARRIYTPPLVPVGGFNRD